MADLNDRFDIDGATFIADSGLIAPDNLDVLEEEGWDDISGMNRRGDNDIAELITHDVPGSEDQRACVVKKTNGKQYLPCFNTTRRTADLQKLAAKTDEMEVVLEDLAEHYVDSQTGRGRHMTERGAAKRPEKNIKRGLYTYEVDEKARDVYLGT